MGMLNSSPVIFKPKLQQSVALSTAEAEYIALSVCVQEILWTRNLLSEIGVRDLGKTILYEDNQSAIAIAMNNGYQSCAKHIDIKYHFIQEQVQQGNIDIRSGTLNQKINCRFFNKSHLDRAILRIGEETNCKEFCVEGECRYCETKRLVPYVYTLFLKNVRRTSEHCLRGKRT